jgi:hypothetical protein
MQKNPFGQLLDQRQRLQEECPPLDACLLLDWRELSGPPENPGRAPAGRSEPAGLAKLPVLEIVERHYDDGTTEVGRERRQERTDLKATRSGDLPEPQLARPASAAGADKPSPLRALFYPDWPLVHTVMPDGTIKTEQAHPDGTVRVHSRFTDGRVQERITDRYGRPFYVCDIARDGVWTVSELEYLDSLGRLSPFLSAKRVTSSDGTVEEERYNHYGKVTERRQYRAST